MRVAVYHGFGKPITIEQVPEPEAGPGDVLVKIGRCGICGSDISMTSGSPFDYVVGCRLGHEYAGEVVETGRGVTELRVGDLVACLPNPGCRECQACRDGRPLFCTQGTSCLGGFGDYVAVPEHGAIRLPQSLSLADGALVEPMACGRRALRMAHFRPGQRVLVLGAGAMALSMIYWARLGGAGEIIVASRSAHRRESVMAMGADLFLSAEKDDPALLDQALATPPDIVAECIGKSGAIDEAIDRVRGDGTVISMGMCTQAEPLMAARCTFKEVRLIFPLAYSIEDFEETARAFDSAGIDPKLMVSETIALEDVPAAFERLRAGDKSLKILVDPSREPAHA